MTRRNEDSGLIDLDALMREAGGSAGEAPQAAPTPAPIAVRPTPTDVPAAAPSGPATVRPPARAAREKTASSPSYATGDVVDIASVRGAPSSSSTADAAPSSAASVSAAAKPAPSSATKPAPTSTAKPAASSSEPAPAAAKPTASVPPAPSTTPSKLWPDSLEAVTTEPPPRSVRESAAAESPAPAPAPAKATAPAAPAPARKRRGPMMAAALAVLALAGAFAFVRTRGATDDTVTTATTPTTARTADTPPIATTATTPAAEAPSDPGASMDELPTVASASASIVRPTSARVAGAGAKAPADEAPAPAATLTEAALAPSGASAAGDLGDAMRGAVGPRDQATSAGTETSSGPNAAQVRPSPGAVVGALGSVLPAARACLAPDDPVRSGLVVFKSDGTVARVELRGSKPEDDCVRSALAKAKVAPFVDDTFSTRVTVRP